MGQAYGRSNDRRGAAAGVRQGDLCAFSASRHSHIDAMTARQPGEIILQKDD
jgi:hypothetical protein